MLENLKLELKTNLFFLLMFALSFFLSGSTIAQPKNEVRVAIVYNTSITGYRYKEGVKVNLKEVIGNYRLTISEKPYLKASHGQDSIKKLIRNEEADIILGPTESDVFINVYNTDGINDNKISVISGLATTDIGNDPQGYFFRLNVEANNRIYVIWSLLNKYWISRPAIIYENTEFGRNSENAFRKLTQDFNSEYKYEKISFESPLIPISEIKKFIIKERPEVVGLFCEREDVQRLYNAIQELNNTSVPYNPYFFTLIDITSVGEGLENIFFPSLQGFKDSISIDNIEKDEVFILGQETANLIENALSSANSTIDFSTLSGRIQFRNQIVGILQGESNTTSNMEFLKMKNLGPLHLYKMNNDKLYQIKEVHNISLFTVLYKKIARIYSTNNFILILNLLLIFILTLSISMIELRTSFPKKHVKIFYTPVFYYFLFSHFLIVLFLYIFLAETGRISYFDTVMVIIISVTPSAFFKTTFFETKYGGSFGLEGVYKRMMANIETQIMKVRYKKLKGLKNLVAYYNSEQSMKNALLRVYKNHPSPIQSAKLIQKMEEKLLSTKDYMERRRVAAELIIRQFDSDQLKGEGFVPQNWKYNNIDPQILIRYLAKYCAENNERKNKVSELCKQELASLEKSNLDKYRELKSVYEKEKSITMSREGEMLVDLRILMVLRNFNLNWLVDTKLLSQKELEKIIHTSNSESKNV